MQPSSDQLIGALGRFNQQQIGSAGQRYTPGIEPGAPNLQAADLLTAVENVACGLVATNRFTDFVRNLTDAWQRAMHACNQCERIQALIEALEAEALALMPRLRACDTTALQQWTGNLSEISAVLTTDLQRWRDQEQAAAPDGSHGKDKQNDSSRDRIRSNINSIGRCLSTIGEEQEFIDSPAGKVLSAPLLLIGGEWGTGKTHALCDVTANRVSTRRITLFLLAKNFQSDVLENVCKRIWGGFTPADLLDQLHRISASRGERALIVIDGVNEGHRDAWRSAISDLIRLVESRSHIGLILSCRTPFERFAISPDDLLLLHSVTHRGFENQEFDAQAAFFQYYKLPLPEVPLLDEEFARPLTLKLICLSLKDLLGKKPAQGFAGIASGQKGMTFILESFVKRASRDIERKFGLPAGACWRLLKGNGATANLRTAGFAPSMAATMRDYVYRTTADRILVAHFPSMKKTRRKELLENLRTSGLIDEDVIWSRSGKQFKPRIVYRLAYQRFSDHLIARHLLESYLHVSSEAGIKRCFSRNTRLGRIFTRNRFSTEYAQPGWAQALITEFPERVKKRVPSKRRELIFFLPRAAQTASYFGPFLEGLFWRAPASFTNGTTRVVNAILDQGRSTSWNRAIDALVAVASKPKHPFHARRLYMYLSKMKMPERDLSWGEYLRKPYYSPTVRRLLVWAQQLSLAEMSEETAKEIVVLLSLVLTTVVRRDRDVATKALVVIGKKYPRVLFDHVLQSLAFNDPYQPERMLAAAYGVTMSLVDGPMPSVFRSHLAWFAARLYKPMFAGNARYSTTHALRRDYALGVIQLAVRAKCVSLPRVASSYLSPPFAQIPSIFSEITSVTPEVEDALGNAIQMDFDNYTIGRLIPDRSNYDNKNLGYVAVRAQIRQRLYDLGYRKQMFGQIDEEIARTSFRASDEVKVDRYGKKYSWIAYFEMYGLRQARKSLPEWRLGERTSDCDIDPSFPKRPSAWTPPVLDLFGDKTLSADSWVLSRATPDFSPLLIVREINNLVGPWILLQGFIQGVRQDLDRELFAFLRGLFVRARDIPRLRRRFAKVDYLGNDRIPDAASDHYVFAAEAGRRTTYAPELIKPSGTYRRQVREAFDKHVEVKLRGARKQVQRITIKFHTANKDVEPPESLPFEPFNKRYRRIPGINVELPIRHFAWESYHSTQNDFSGFLMPAPSLLERLQLLTCNREVDFRDQAGDVATVYREDGDKWKWKGDQFQLLYLREDLVRQYLRSSRQKLVWCNWGERRWASGDMDEAIRSQPVRVKAFHEHLNIHRSFHELDKVQLASKKKL